MNRILVFDNADNYLFDIDPNQLISAVITEEVNGVHALDLSTSQTLAQSNRLLTANDMGIWEEYVVVNDSSQHDNGSRNAYGTIHAIWSIQYDLMTVYGEDVESGGEHDVVASVAMANALNGTRRWTVGTVDVGGEATIEMFGNSAYERLQSIQEAYGGEIRADITVGQNCVTGRSVSLLESLGSQIPTRRFEWKRDVTSIKRKAQETPLCCRIIPVGKSDEVTIEDVNNGIRYLQDNEAALAYRMPDGRGSWEYPTKKVKFSEIDDDRQLLAYATEHITDYTRPVPTYEASVLQYAAAGMSYQGVALGDVIQIVDYGFNPDVPLRLEGRARKIVRSLVNDNDVVLTIGDVSDSLALSFQKIDSALASVKSRIDKTFGASLTSTETYLDWLTGQMNGFINALGGYTYIVPGRGIVTYSVEVSDPEVGAEAKAEVPNGNGSVTEIRGGAVRIANTLTPTGDWDFRTVLLPGQIAAEMITAGHIVSGWIGSADAAGNYSGHGNFINFDTGETHLSTQLSSRNSLRNGSFFMGTEYWSSSGVTLSVENDDDFSHRLKAVQSAAGGSSRCFYPNTSTSFTHENGITYTLTFWAKANADNKLTVCRAASATDRYFDEVDVTTSWQQYAATMDSTGTGSLSFWLKTAGTLYLAEVMVNVGRSSIGYADNPEDMNQEAVLYRLTGGYANEGLYINNGHLYMNATYIHGGTFKAGGANNVNGVIEVYDASNTLTSKFDKDGAYIKGDVEIEKDSCSAKIGNFTDSVRSYTGSTSGTQYGLKVSSGNSEYNTIVLIPYANGLSGGLVACRSALTVAGYTRESYGPYLSLSSSSTVVGAKGSNGARLYLDSREGSCSQGSGTVFHWDYSDGLTVQNDLYVSGNKHRLVETQSYGKRPLSAYETPEPMFGDVGSGIIGEDGLCYVSIDPIFAETARTDLRYYVFLQGYDGQSVSVAEKTAAFFVVSGQPGAKFDWEIKAKQRGFENVRMDDYDLRRAVSTSPLDVLSDTIDMFDSNLESYVQDVKDCLEEAI